MMHGDQKRGSRELVLNKRFIGHEKDLKRISEAMQTVHTTILLGENVETESPGLLEQGLKLYRDLFPNPDEREDEELIRSRLHNSSLRRSSKGCFDIFLGKDKDGNVISWHQFSTLPLRSGAAIAYMQYTGCASDTFMQKEYGKKENVHGHGIYTYNIALMQQVADENARTVLGCSQGVQGYILETEMLGQALTEEEIRYTKRRLEIHGHTGARAVMLQLPDGRLFSPHFQPALGNDSGATKLLLLYRSLRYDVSDTGKIGSMQKDEALGILMAFIENFNTEQFDAALVNDAKMKIQDWFESAESTVLVPPSLTPDIVELSSSDPILLSVIERDFGASSDHAKRILAALR